MNDTRDTKIVNGFITNGFTFKGVHYKPLTARTLVLLEKAKSPFYFGGDQLRGLLDLLYINSHDTTTVIEALDGGSFELKVLEFSEDFTTTDLEELGALVDAANNDVAAAVVEVREEAGKKK